MEELHLVDLAVRQPQYGFPTLQTIHFMVGHDDMSATMRIPMDANRDFILFIKIAYR